MINIGKILKELRTERNLTLRELEDLTGLSNGYLSQLENNKRGLPRIDTIHKLVEAYQISMVDLIRKLGFDNENVSPDNEEGTKYDQGKARIGEMVIDFVKPLSLVCKVWEFGANKYAKSNWKKVDNGAERYTNAMVRHLVLEETEGVDQETGIHHAVHVAWNALARLYFIIKE